MVAPGSKQRFYHAMFIELHSMAEILCLLSWLTASAPQRNALLTTGKNSRSSLLPPPTSSFPPGRWTLTHFPSSPVRLAAYLQQQVEQDSLTAFSTASRVSPVRF